MSPTHWPVGIYLADHTLEERHAAAWDDAGRFEHLKALHYESQSTQTYVKESYQPRVLTKRTIHCVSY
jgi:hypothetical protein